MNLKDIDKRNNMEINNDNVDRSVYKHKDGGLYTIHRIVEHKLFDNTVVEIVEYSPIYTNRICVRTMEHFKSSFEFDHNIDSTMLNSRKAKDILEKRK